MKDIMWITILASAYVLYLTQLLYGYDLERQEEKIQSSEE